MKVSRKEYLHKQNQATGYIVNLVFVTLYMVFLFFREMRAYQAGLEFEQFFVFISIIGILVGIPVSIWRWRKVECELKGLEIDSSLPNDYTVSSKVFRRKSNESIAALILGFLGIGFVIYQLIQGIDDIGLVILGCAFAIIGLWQWRFKEKELKDLDVGDS